VAAQEELRRPAAALFWSASAAGLTIGFSFLAGAYLMALAPADYSGAATAVGYPLGFVFVALARGQLFTENTLEPIIPFLPRPTFKILRQLLSLWVVVPIGNLAGACAFAAIAALTPMLNETLTPHADRGSENGRRRRLLAGGIACDLCGLADCTDGLADCLHARDRRSSALNLAHYRAYFGARFPSLRSRLGGGVLPRFRAHGGLARDGRGFVLPAVVGNIVGGFVFVAPLNHGQVAADRAGDAGPPSV
jgi:formate/nitrite transporter FocA (FNT family)